MNTDYNGDSEDPWTAQERRHRVYRNKRGLQQAARRLAKLQDIKYIEALRIVKAQAEDQD